MKLRKEVSITETYGSYEAEVLTELSGAIVLIYASRDLSEFLLELLGEVDKTTEVAQNDVFCKILNKIFSAGTSIESTDWWEYLGAEIELTIKGLKINLYQIDQIEKQIGEEMEPIDAKHIIWREL